MRSKPLPLLAVFALAPLFSQAEERPAIYPFDVTVAGQAADYKDAFPIFAKVLKPVAPDAEVTLGIEAEQIIVNVFPCNLDGTVDSRAPAKVILVPEGTSFKLDATMDKTTLGPGLYGMNIVVGSKGTSRVMFVVGGDGADAPAPPAVAATPDKPDSPPAPPVAPAGDAVDQSSPESTLSALFAAAKSGDLTPLLAITPEGEDVDGDVRQIRESATADADLQAKFAKFFADGKIDGEARIDGDKAEVDFLFGPGATRSETMNLVLKDGKWYLDSF